MCLTLYFSQVIIVPKSAYKSKTTTTKKPFPKQHVNNEVIPLLNSLYF